MAPRGGADYEVIVEGSLKLMDMSQSHTRVFYLPEHRPGPIGDKRDAARPRHLTKVVTLT